MSIMNSVNDQQRPANISDENLADFKTKYHFHSKQPTLFQTSNAFHVHKPSNPPQDPAHWCSFWCRGDFKFAEIVLEASLNKEQVEALLGLISCVAKGEAEITFWSEAELHKLCDWAMEELTPVSRCETFWLCTVRYDANQVYYLQFIEHTISVPYKKQELSYVIHVRSMWQWVLNLLNNPHFAPHFIWNTEWLYKWDGVQFDWFYDEPWTTDWWWDIHGSCIWIMTECCL